MVPTQVCTERPTQTPHYSPALDYQILTRIPLLLVWRLLKRIKDPFTIKLLLSPSSDPRHFEHIPKTYSEDQDEVKSTSINFWQI